MEIETNREEGDGNSNPLPNGHNINIKSKKQGLQLKNWFFTFNNYLKHDPKMIEILETRFQEICKCYCFQEEIGECGTPHLQGCLELNHPMRWTEFKLHPGIHWEKTRNRGAAIDYCRKAATRNGKTFQFGLPKPIQLITLDEGELDLVNYLLDENNVKLNGLLEIEEARKLPFVKYMMVKHHATMVPGKIQDAAEILYKTDMNKCSIVFVSKAYYQKKDDGNWTEYTSTVEALTQGMVAYPKAKNGYLIFNTPHILII